jgi:hypothetical protein
VKTVLIPSVALLVASVGATAAIGDVKSGLQVGESVPAYYVTDITGPNKDRSVCYR